MKTQNIKSTSKRVRTTKADKAGLSLLRPRLIEIIEDNYVYFNEILQNIYTTVLNIISKPISPFIVRLTSKKFSNCSLLLFPNQRKIIVKTHSSLKRAFFRPPFSSYKFSF